MLSDYVKLRELETWKGRFRRPFLPPLPMTRRTCLDFDLQLTRHPDGYTARVLQSPAGQASATGGSVIAGARDDLAVQKMRMAGKRWLRLSVMNRSGCGVRLCFARSFAMTCWPAWARVWSKRATAAAACASICGLSEAPELIALPWEYLFHPALDRFLALSAETTLVHYLDLPRKAPPLSVSLPLHILVVMATPKDLPCARQREGVARSARRHAPPDQDGRCHSGPAGHGQPARLAEEAAHAPLPRAALHRPRRLDRGHGRGRPDVLRPGRLRRPGAGTRSGPGGERRSLAALGGAQRLSGRAWRPDRSVFWRCPDAGAAGDAGSAGHAFNDFRPGCRHC